MLGAWRPFFKRNFCFFYLFQIIVRNWSTRVQIGGGSVGGTLGGCKKGSGWVKALNLTFCGFENFSGRPAKYGHPQNFLRY